MQLTSPKIRFFHHGSFKIAVLAAAALVQKSQLYAAEADSLRYETEVRATFSSGENTPFWLVNNLQGLGSPKKNNGYVRAALFKDLDPSKRFSWSAGIDLVGAWNYPAPFQIHQLYGEIKYRSLGVIVGSKEIYGDYNDPNLSSGGLLYSGNALPIPQVRVGIFDFTPFPGTKRWLSVKGYLSYGMFTDSKWQESWSDPNSKYAKNVLFHSKGLWLRGGIPEKFPLTADVGIEMAAQFGGTAYKGDKAVHMKCGFKEWWKAFFPTYTTQETLLGELSSVEGNMVGQYTIGLQYHPKDNRWGLRGYFEHFFEDQSQMTFEYGWQDGLWGIEAIFPKNRFVSKFVYEFLHTKDQTGAVNHDKTPEIPEQVSGRDEYYNHSFYPGWQHWGMGIGNPLLISPIYNADHVLKFYDTRVVAHHFGIAGNPTPQIDYRLLISYSRNWGTYTYPLPEVLENFNALLEVNWSPRQLKGWFGSLSLACDGGELLGKSFGVGITIGKTGLFSF